MTTVRLACLPGESKYFVIKSIRKDAIMQHNEEKHIRSEKACLLRLSSPFCVKLFATYSDRKYICFAMEYLPGGDLHHTRLSRYAPYGFPAEHVRFYLTEVACALEHVHSLQMVHRSLSPENIAIDEDGHIKLIDFGYATACSAGQRLLSICGKPAYMSPEQLRCTAATGYSGYGQEVDWWSYGVVLFELITGKTPFWKDDSDSYEVLSHRVHQRIHFVPSFEKSSKEIVLALLRPGMHVRMCKDVDVKQHAYFKVPWEVMAQRRVIPPFIPHLSNSSADVSYFSGQQGQASRPQAVRVFG